MTQKSVFPIILLLIVSNLFGQQPTWQIKTRNSFQKPALQITAISNDTLLYKGPVNIEQINIQSISQITKIKPSKITQYAKRGLLIGSIAGLIAGIIQNERTKTDEYYEWYFDFSGLYIGGFTLTGGIGGLVIGGTIGAICSMDQHYDLAGMNLRQKKYFISIRIIKKNPKAK